MSSVLYLLAMGIKNSLLDLRKKPGKLVLYTLILLLIIFMAVVSFKQGYDAEDMIPLYWLKGIFFAYLSMFVISAVNNGLSSGGSFFEMSDVNLLFVSPVSSRLILIYGVARLATMSFLAGLFILFQSSTLKTFFGIGYGGVWMIMLIYTLSVICLPILSVIIYNFVGGREGRKRIIKGILVLMYAPAAVFFIGQIVLSAQDVQSAAAAVIQSPLISGVPVAGWAAESITAFVAGETLRGWLFVGFIVLTIAGALVYLVLSKLDYYEDVLCATETTFEKKRAMQEGNINAYATGRSVRVAATGVIGRGGSAIAGKHLREHLRENRFAFFGWSTVLMTAGAAAMAYLLDGKLNLVMITAAFLYIQVLKIGMGRGLKELYMHYIYLIPEPPFSKVIWSNLEVVIKAFVESVLIFTAAGIVLGEGVAVIAGAVAAYTVFTLLLIGVNYLSMRLVGPDISPIAILFIYLVAMIVIMLPGAIPAIVVGVMVGGPAGSALGLLVVTAWELISAVVCIALSKGVLHNCDMPVLKTVK